VLERIRKDNKKTKKATSEGRMSWKTTRQTVFKVEDGTGIRICRAGCCSSGGISSEARDDEDDEEEEEDEDEEEEEEDPSE
jgi:hypothetical protein